MMKPYHSARMALLLMLTALVGLGGSFLAVGLGCGTAGPGVSVAGINPAAPPSPPAEIPAALQIPSGQELAIGAGSKISGGSSTALVESAALKAATAATCDPSVDFSKSIGPVGQASTEIEQDLSSLLNPYSQLVIPVGTNIHNFAGLSVVQDVGPQVLVEMRIDFSDFDFDGDGVKEGCSGNTQQLPICMRIWANGKKEMAGVFTDYPTKDKPGAGRMMGLNITNSTFLFPENGFLEINYDHHDPSKRVSTELLTREADPCGFRVHFLADQNGDPTSAIDTVGASFTGGHEIGTSVVQAIFRFKQDASLVSGSLDLEPPRGSSEPNFSDQCIDLTTGHCVDASQCVDLGIDMSGVPFLDIPSDAEVFLPADFPDSPTF